MCEKQLTLVSERKKGSSNLPNLSQIFSRCSEHIVFRKHSRAAVATMDRLQELTRHLTGEQASRKQVACLYHAGTGYAVPDIDPRELAHAAVMHDDLNTALQGQARLASPLQV